MSDRRSKRPRPPLDAGALERLALHYVGRYATTRAKLADYLRRKTRERGWEGEGTPDFAALSDRFSEMGYIDDRAFAAGRARAFEGRGLGKGRLRMALKAAGVEEEDAAPAHEIADAGRWAAAMRFAQKRRIGPFAAEAPDRAGREKAIAAMIRAGHGFDIARTIASARPGEPPEEAGV